MKTIITVTPTITDVLDSITYAPTPLALTSNMQTFTYNNPAVIYDSTIHTYDDSAVFYNDYLTAGHTSIQVV